jgi:aspartyl-tRNA(Asn)/glutamyl-tRNA(Gln) amidotransferase subunit A
LSSGYYDAYYNKANIVRELIKDDYKKAFEKVDIIITPTTPDAAFKIGEKINDPIKLYLEDIFTVPANLAGVPAISIPSGVKETGTNNLPLGLQLFASQGGEELLFKVASDFENK